MCQKAKLSSGLKHTYINNNDRSLLNIDHYMKLKHFSTSTGVNKTSHAQPSGDGITHIACHSFNGRRFPPYFNLVVNLSQNRACPSGSSVHSRYDLLKMPSSVRDSSDAGNSRSMICTMTSRPSLKMRLRARCISGRHQLLERKWGDSTRTVWRDLAILSLIVSSSTLPVSKSRWCMTVEIWCLSKFSSRS